MISKAAAPKKSRKHLSSETLSGISAKQRALYASFATNILAQRKTSRQPIVSASMDVETNVVPTAASKQVDVAEKPKPRDLSEFGCDDILQSTLDQEEGLKNAYLEFEKAKDRLTNLGMKPNGKL